ncbi:QacE family quaternary ammonium compound efflux SMR transporter [Salicibibacter cibi]|uniref:QacE family quaternary ammonium compound efflux SMR transporter n=1 Tax=Salicibibacter cibi TaxID=2743001 RepID=A0A7T6ZDN7_9BACI|nr:SMR family transporter [Salicibibacter cibi]QQK81487.1 QacE family quaternary ammonium compound efflux SMR transporter [Salicibibacter cibi]
MFYFLLILSIIFEVAGASFMPAAANNWNMFIVVMGCWYVALILYIYLTNQSEVGIISAIFTGGGTVFIAMSGIILFGETISFLKFLGIGLIIAGVIGINVKPTSAFGKETKH